MNRYGIAVCAALAATLVVAAPKKPAKPKVSHVPEDVTTLRPIRNAAARANHVMIANVGAAIPSAEWPRIVTCAASRLQINIWTNSIKKAVFPQVIGDPAVLERTFGPKARFCVLVEDADDPTPYVAAPGAWCRVNVRPLKADGPDRQTFADRCAKAILNGIARACGASLGLDSRSATYHSARDAKALDEVNITITPETYFPMLDIIGALGGTAMQAPALDEK